MSISENHSAVAIKRTKSTINRYIGFFTLCSLASIPPGVSYNIRTNQSHLVRIPSGGSSVDLNFFGYDFVWSLSTKSQPRKVSILVGSPKTLSNRQLSRRSHVSSVIGHSNHPGDLFSCGIYAKDGNSSCQSVNPSAVDLKDLTLLVGGESVGVSVLKSNGNSELRNVVTCAPLRLRNCSSTYLTHGACFSSTDFGEFWSKQTRQAAAHCPVLLVDLIFVLDGSGSVTASDPKNFEMLKSWVKTVSSTFDLREFARIGVIQYSHWYESRTEQQYMKTEIELGQYRNQRDFEKAVDRIQIQGYTTFTAHAINKTVKDFMDSDRFNNTSTRKVMILLTDGRSDDVADLPNAAGYARSVGITTFAVGVAGYSVAELQIIATGEIGNNLRVYGLQRFSDLQKIVGSLQKSITGILEGAVSNETNELQNSEVGIGGTISKNGRLYLGAVGAYDWSGTVTKYDSMEDTLADIPSYPEVQKVLPNRTKESYMGYSVTTGTFNDEKTEYVATGAPRYQLMGAVVIYRPINNNNKFNDHVRLMGHKSQRKLGSYFGGSVLALDINGDNKDDLLIGAPLYVHENYDEGRVFVYESFRGSNTLAEWAKDTYVPVELVGDNLAGGRFGTAMASAGDLNKDNYNDVIIGAPLADGDRGAVFVYHGSSNGIDPAFKQKILASQLSGVTLKYFGQSLQGGVDLDGNKYPDIAVGAPKSDTVVIFRSRPVVNIATEIKFLGDSVIDISNCIIDNSYINCSTIKVCFTATGESIEPSIGVKFNVSMDTTKAELDKRLEFRDQSALSSSPKFTWSMETNLAPKTEKCFSKKVNMKSNVKDYDSSVIAEVEYELTPQHTAEPMSSVRDPSKTNKASAWLNFTQNCDGPCDPNLGVTLSLDIPPYTTKTAPIKDLSENKTILVLDKSTTVSHLPVRVNLSNSGENAFGAKVRIKHTQMINYRNVRVIEENPRSGNSCIIKESSPEPENGLRTQILRFNSKTNIMPENSYCYFEVSLIMDPLRNDGSLDNFVVEVEAFVYDADGSSKDTNTDNNAQSQTTKLMYTSDMNLKELSIPDISFNHTTVPVRNITSIKEIGNNTDDIVIQFTILGRGYTNMPVVAATLDYPSKTSDNGTLLYLYKVECSNKNSGSQTTCTCDDNIINPHNLSMEAPGANSTDMNYITATRRNTAMEMFQYNCYNMSSSALCEKLKCNIRNLAESDEVVFKAFFRLFTDNLYFNENETNERLELRSRFEISSRPSPNIIDENGVKPIVKTGESVINARLYTTPVPPEPVANNLWIYIVAAIGGLLLLIVLVVILWKLGFFKSKYADLKKDAQDDVADETEFADQNGSK